MESSHLSSASTSSSATVARRRKLQWNETLRWKIKPMLHVRSTWQQCFYSYDTTNVYLRHHHYHHHHHHHHHHIHHYQALLDPYAAPGSRASGSISSSQSGTVRYFFISCVIVGFFICYVIVIGHDSNVVLL